MKCHNCGEPLHEFVQPALLKGKMDRVKVECHNPFCALFHQTLDALTYPTLDLTPYLSAPEEWQR